MRDAMLHRSSRPVVAVLAVLALLAPVVTGCRSDRAVDRTAVADVAVSVAGLDPLDLLEAVPRSATVGWQVDGDGPVPVAIADIRPDDADRADRYAEAGFQAGARLSLVRGESDRIAVMVDRFVHAAAAHQVEDWHLSTTGSTLVDGVSRVGATAEGVMVVEDLLVRVVAVGDEVPDETAVRDLLAAVEEVVLPRV